MNQWAIAIGINQYQHLQPLSLAQRDAQALRNFLVQDRGWAEERCWLLTDTSPSAWGKSTYPTRQTILDWLDRLHQHYLQPDDVLWIFFCGYGVCRHGRDYLVPIDGDPARIETTGIAVEELFDRLTKLPLEPVLLLDINRSQSALSHQTVGEQIANLANRTGISTLLSCRPGQFSREAAALGHGFFTAALLESLRLSEQATLAGVEHYLNDRLPELSEHYWRPIQQPLTISPPEKIHRVILDRVSLNPDKSNWGWSASTPVHPLVHTLDANAVDARNHAGHFANSKNSLPARDGSAEISWSDRSPTQPSLPTAQAHLSSPNLSPNSIVNQPNSNPSSSNDPSIAASDRLFWRRVLIWGGLGVVLLLVGVLLRNWTAITQASPPTAASPSPIVKSPNPSPTSTVPPSPTQDVFVPKPPESVNNLTTPGSGAASGRSPLQSARLMIKSDQASPYYFAIREARKVQPGQPDYAAAQQEIAGWSQDLLNIAKRRAGQKSFDTAILALSLIPTEQPVYAQARSAFKQWCPALPTQPIKNSLQQRQAGAICRGQAK